MEHGIVWLKIRLAIFDIISINSGLNYVILMEITGLNSSLGTLIASFSTCFYKIRR